MAKRLLDGERRSPTALFVASCKVFAPCKAVEENLAADIDMLTELMQDMSIRGSKRESAGRLEAGSTGRLAGMVSLDIRRRDGVGF